MSAAFVTVLDFQCLNEAQQKLAVAHPADARMWAPTGGEIRMDNLLQKLMLGGSTAALFAAMPVAAFAQGAGDIEQVVVSASRIQIAGYQQPTPVSVVGGDELLGAA